MTSQRHATFAASGVLHLPVPCRTGFPTRTVAGPSEAARLVQAYLGSCVAEIAHAAAGRPAPGVVADPARVVRTILSSSFNYQSRGRVAHLVPQVTERIDAAMAASEPVRLFLLYHGGYRSSFAGRGLTFEPDVTELLLLYQIARLRRALHAIGGPDFLFTIVVNNGVAAATNGIGYARTEGYARRLRALIDRAGAGAFVSVLVQSEIEETPFEEQMRALHVEPRAAIDAAEHGIIERFLGRACSIAEACLKSAVYEQAERVWGTRIGGIVDAAGGIVFRQIAHPECLSFRPFPGGAIRVQNGTVGFRIERGAPVPTLISHATAARATVTPMAIRCPMLAAAERQDETVPILQVA
jgi:hypothetical protein